MSTTYLYKYNITDIYSAFSKNRKNKLIDVKVTPKDGNNSHKYLGVFQNDDMTYIYADKTSPYPLNDNGINNVSLNINNSTSYNIYSKHSYTYTEGISANNSDIRLFLLAYDYVTNPNNFESLDDQSIKMNTIGIVQNAPSHDLVNVYSDITYSIEGNGRTIDVLNEFKLNYNDFKTLLGNKNYVDCTSYIKYSYIQHAVQHDGIVHTDGKQKLTQDIVNQIRDFRVWSFTDGYDKTIYTYTDDGDGTPINAYAFINLGDESQSYFCSQYNNDQKMINPEYVQKTSTSFTPTWLISHNENNKVYLAETGQQYRNFYKNAKPYNLSGHENDSFMSICTHPSYRNNNRICDFYVDIKANSNRSTDALNYQKWVNEENYNLCKYIKRMSLPIHIVNNELTIYLYDNFYYTDSQDVQNIQSLYTQSDGYDTGGDILLYLDFNDPTFNTEFNIKFNCRLAWSNPDNSIYSSGFSGFPATTSELMNFHITEVTKKTQEQYPGNYINFNASKSDLYQNKIVFDITTSVNELSDHSSKSPLNNVSITLDDNHKNNQSGSNISHIGFNDNDAVSSGKPIFYGRVYCNKQFDFHHSSDSIGIFDDPVTDGKINFYYLDADDLTSCSMQYHGNYLVPSKLNTSDSLNGTDWPIESLHIFPPFKFIYGNNGSGTNDEVNPPTNTISLTVTNTGGFDFTAFSGTMGAVYIKIKKNTVRNVYFSCSENAYIKFDDITIGQSNYSLDFRIKEIESGSELQQVSNGQYSGCYYLIRNADYVFELITYDDDILYSQGMTLEEFIDYLDNHDNGLTLDIRAKIAKSGENLPTQSSTVINYYGTYVEY